MAAKKILFLNEWAKNGDMFPLILAEMRMNLILTRSQ